MYTRFGLKPDYVSVIFSYEVDVSMQYFAPGAAPGDGSDDSLPRRICAPRQLDGGHETAGAQGQGLSAALSPCTQVQAQS